MEYKYILYIRPDHRQAEATGMGLGYSIRAGMQCASEQSSVIINGRKLEVANQRYERKRVVVHVDDFSEDAFSQVSLSQSVSDMKGGEGAADEPQLQYCNLPLTTVNFKGPARRCRCCLRDPSIPGVYLHLHWARHARGHGQVTQD